MMNLPISAIWPGTPFSRGAHWDGEGVNFALYSENAEREPDAGRKFKGGDSYPLEARSQVLLIERKNG